MKASPSFLFPSSPTLDLFLRQRGKKKEEEEERDVRGGDRKKAEKAKVKDFPLPFLLTPFLSLKRHFCRGAFKEEGEGEKEGKQKKAGLLVGITPYKNG